MQEDLEKELEKEAPHVHTTEDPLPQEECGTCLEHTITDLEKKIQQLEKEKLVLMAETENRCRRLEGLSKDREQFAITAFSKELLAVADSLQCALNGQGAESSSPFHKGIELTSSLLQNIFEKFGIMRIHPLYHMFNPELHQAIKEVPDTAYEKGTVVEVLQEGYTLHHRVLRAALVVVASETGGNE